MNERPTVFVVDDDPAMRDSLGFLLGSVQLPVECHASAEELLSANDSQRPGCIVLDVRMPGLSGLELMSHLRVDRSAPPVLLISGHGDVPMAVQALKNGAFDFIEKPFSDAASLERIQLALQQDEATRSEAATRLDIEQRHASLTPREAQVLDAVVAGKANKVIAQDLGLSQKTIEVHRAHVMEKMRADSVAHLVKMAVALDVTGPPQSVE